MNKKVDKIKKSGRDSIIKSAIKLIDENIDVNNYLIKVKANKTSVIVSFHIPIIYLTFNSVYLCNYGADLSMGSTWADIISNPKDYGTDQNDISNYIPSKDTKMHIQFVLEAIHKSDEIGSIDINDFRFEDQMIIRDTQNYYDITMLSTHQESWYKIDKRSGKLFDSGHAHLIPPPLNEDDDNIYEEIVN